MLAQNPYLVALIALVPGVVAWWTGRSIATRTSDAALPELLWSHRQRMRSVFFTSFFLAPILGGRHAFWGLPLMSILATIGADPLRRSLGIETASLFRQLWRNTKSIIGGLGFWIAIILAPMIVLSIDARYRPLGLLLIPLLLAWEHWYQPIWLRAHDAEPLTDPHLVSRFKEIDARAGLASPRVYRVGGRDARFMNAVALPNISDPAVGLGNALIELLEPDEVAAIYAHELSHIHQFSSRKNRRRRLITRGLIVASVLIPLATVRFAPVVSPWVPWVWPLVAMSALAFRGRGSKNRETESDLRAAEWCGDAEVMIRALIKVHVHGFIPRRWDVDFERQASHPSLTRRIQALRGDTVHAAASPVAPVVFPTAREGSVVAFDDTRAYWFDGVPADAPSELDALRTLASSVRSVAWGELVELRVVTRDDDRALQARHRNGDSWSVPLEPSRVDAMQKALDLVDVRLRRDLGKRPVFDMRLVATVMIVAILWAGEAGLVLVPSLVAVFRPTTVMLAGVGSMAAASGFFGLLREWSTGEGLVTRFIILIGLGGAAVGIAWYRARREPRRDGHGLATYTFGGLAAAMVIAVVLTATELPLRDLVVGGIMRTLSVSLIALATVLSFVRARASKAAAISASVLAVVAIAPTVAEMDLFGGADRFARQHSSATEIAHVALDGNAFGLSLSPTGDHFLVRALAGGGDDSDDEDRPSTSRSRFTIGSLNGTTRTFNALQAALVDESHVLLLRRAGEAFELLLEGDDSVAVWTMRLPDVRRPILTVSSHGDRWTILANAPASDSLIVISGTQAGGEPVVRRMASGNRAPSEKRVFDIAQSIGIGERVVTPAFEYKMSSVGMLTMLATPRQSVDLWETTAAGEQKITHLEGIPQCGPPDETQAYCVVRLQRDRGQLWSVGQTGPARYLAPVPLEDLGRLFIGPGARVSGLRSRTHDVVAIDIAARKVSTIDVPAAPGFVSEVRTAPGRLVTVRFDNGRATIVAYRVEGL